MGIQTEDYLWAVVFLASPANVTMLCGPSNDTESLPSGVSKVKLWLTAGCSVAVEVRRDGLLALEFAPDGFKFSENPPSYNFNAFVAASP